MASPPVAADIAVVDGTRRECTGVIAALERAMDGLRDGTAVCALVGDVPTHIEVLAWAERKGHAVASDLREPGRFRMEIVKSARGRWGPPDGPRAGRPA